MRLARLLRQPLQRAINGNKALNRMSVSLEMAAAAHGAHLPLEAGQAPGA